MNQTALVGRRQPLGDLPTNAQDLACSGAM
jgi:hypothetical protein